MAADLKLYTYWRSSAAYRVRIALNLKGLCFESVPIHLVRQGGEQHREEYRCINPQGLVPQVYNADRYGQDMSPYPEISEIVKNCWELPEFHRAAPENQPDATPD